MNKERVMRAIQDIDYNTKALDWLTQYGDSLHKGNVCFSIRADLAGSCPGYSEATSMMEVFAGHLVTELVEQSIQNCRNTIRIAKDALIEEASA